MHQNEQQIQAFMSYAPFDDKHDGRYLSTLRDRLSGELHSRSGKPFPIKNTDDVAWGEIIETSIAESIHTATCFIPIVTPSYLNDSKCRKQLQQFAALGRPILPIYYIECPEIKAQNPSDEIAQILKKYQYIDWRKLRRVSFDDHRVQQKLEDMAVQILQAMGLLPSSGSSQGGSHRKPVPIHLPYKVDRKTQEYELEQAIVHHQQHYPHRPFVCIVHGDTKQCHDTFCEYLYEKFLPRVLFLSNDETVMENRISCPESIQDFQQWSQQFLRNLSAEVSNYKHTTAETINENSLVLPVPVFIHTHITIQTFRPIWKETVTHYLRFWDSWPNTHPGQKLLLAFLFVQYKPFQEVKGWLERKQYQKQKDRFWGEVMNSNLTTINCAVLPSIENVTRDHVLDWSKSLEIRDNWHRRDWQTQIHAFFDKHKTDELPLATVAEHLTKLLQECQP